MIRFRYKEQINSHTFKILQKWKKSNNFDTEYIKEELKWAINGIDIAGCELSQNISKKFKEKEKEKEKI